MVPFRPTMVRELAQDLKIWPIVYNRYFSKLADGTSLDLNEGTDDILVFDFYSNL